VSLIPVRRRSAPRVLAAAIVAAALMVGLGGGAQALASPGPGTRATTLYIVRYRPGSDVRAQARTSGISDTQVTRRLSHVFPGMFARLTPAQRDALRADPSVAAVEADGPVRATDTEVNPPWGLDRIDQRALPLSTTYSYGPDGAGVTAYVIDTGIFAAHADFGGRVAAGYNAVDDANGTDDCNGHGTHVAGTIAGARYGVAKLATLVPVRVLDCTGSGYVSAAIAGLDWVAANHLDGAPAVANLSLGADPSSSLDAAVAAVVADGVTVAVAAGNETTNACNSSPAAEPTALTVAASSSTDAQASFSNYGSCVDLYAPGVFITSDWTTSTTATAVLSGTSMASPHVAGVAALITSAHPTWTPAQVSALLLADATTGAVGGATTGTPNRLLYESPALADPPAAPAIGVASGSNASAVVRWTAPSSSLPITGYSVRAVNATTLAQVGALRPASAGATSVTVTGLVNGTAVKFQVRAASAAGTGGYSAFSNTVTPATVPGAPVIGTTTAGNTTATARWTPPANGGRAVTGYLVRVANAATNSPIGTLRPAASDATSLLVTGLVNGTAVKIQVRATNSLGSGAYSALSNAATPATVPGAPAIGTSTAANGSATARWAAAASGGLAVTGYTVRVVNASTKVQIGALRSASAAARSLTVTGLVNGTAVKLQVRATNAVGTGSYSSLSNSVTPRP
jgi:subtilisin family serine protease